MEAIIKRFEKSPDTGAHTEQVAYPLEITEQSTPSAPKVPGDLTQEIRGSYFNLQKAHLGLYGARIVSFSNELDLSMLPELINDLDAAIRTLYTSFIEDKPPEITSVEDVRRLLSEGYSFHLDPSAAKSALRGARITQKKLVKATGYRPNEISQILSGKTIPGGGIQKRALTATAVVFIHYLATETGYVALKK